MNNLTRLLATTRRRKGLSLRQLSAASGIDTATLWRIEEGKTDPRVATQLLPLVNALEIELPALLAALTRKKGKP